jgi:asparagine synthase (glutamine-hydrolysing)
MCGLAGSLFLEPSNSASSLNEVRQMIQAQKHRGPDGQGYWGADSGRVFLGHCRLAIIDLTPTGQQPMASRDGRYVICFNGEIYNYLELKRELQEEGVQFRGNSDTEVLLEGIARWGMDRTLNKLLGMFAFALWDTLENLLFLARDRAGKKPLYYYQSPDAWYFASEHKAFKVLPDIKLTYDQVSIYHYLTFGYVPAPRTIYQEVAEVPAGHYLEVTSELQFTVKSYWRPDWTGQRQVDFAAAVEETERLLQDAVKIRLRADVPVGCFLSGGIDSGLLTAFASAQMGRPLQTFTVSFREGAFDESPLARLVAEKYQTEHHVIVLSPQLREVLPQVIRAYDDPMADPSIIPSYCISQEARKLLKVVLNGEGGDELFGGYRRQLAMKWFSQAQGMMELVPAAGWRKLSRLLPPPQEFRSRYAFVHRFLRGLGQDTYERYIAWTMDGFTEEEKARLYGAENRTSSASVQFLRQAFEPLEHLPAFQHFLALDFLLNMHDDMLVKMDISTMAHGLEGRNPFLDHRLVEWAIGLPPVVKLRGYGTKPLLRELAHRYLPQAVATAPKRGFEIPLIEWLRRDLRELVQDYCLSSGGIIMGMFRRGYLADLLAERLPLDPDRWSRRVFNLLVLAIWEDTNR